MRQSEFDKWVEKHLEQLKDNFIEQNNDDYLDFLHNEFEDNKEVYEEE